MLRCTSQCILPKRWLPPVCFCRSQVFPSWEQERRWSRLWWLCAKTSDWERSSSRPTMTQANQRYASLNRHSLHTCFFYSPHKVSTFQQQLNNHENENICTFLIWSAASSLSFSFTTSVCPKTSVKTTWSWWTAPCPPGLLLSWPSECCWYVYSCWPTNEFHPINVPNFTCRAVSSVVTMKNVMLPLRILM